MKRLILIPTIIVLLSSLSIPLALGDTPPMPEDFSGWVIQGAKVVSVGAYFNFRVINNRTSSGTVIIDTVPDGFVILTTLPESRSVSLAPDEYIDIIVIAPQQTGIYQFLFKIWGYSTTREISFTVRVVPIEVNPYHQMEIYLIIGSLLAALAFSLGINVTLFTYNERKHKVEK